MRTSLSIRAALSSVLTLGALSACTSGPESPGRVVLAGPRTQVDLSTLTPLVCPLSGTQQSPVGFLGLFGGTLSLGANQFVVPSGALLGLTAFQITLPAGDAVEADVSAVGLTSFLFQTPVSITIDYSRCADDAIPAGAALQVVYIDSQSKQMLAPMGGVDDPVARQITFQTSHLSGYEVAYAVDSMSQAVIGNRLQRPAPNR